MQEPFCVLVFCADEPMLQRLRAKLGPQEGARIETLRGVGYRLRE